MATDQRGRDDEQSAQEGDQRSTGRTLENRLAASWPAGVTSPASRQAGSREVVWCS